MDISGRVDLASALDTGEETFNVRPIAPHLVAVKFVFMHKQSPGFIPNPVPAWV